MLENICALSHTDDHVHSWSDQPWNLTIVAAWQFQDADSCGRRRFTGHPPLWYQEWDKSGFGYFQSGSCSTCNPNALQSCSGLCHLNRQQRYWLLCRNSRVRFWSLPCRIDVDCLAVTAVTWNHLKFWQDRSGSYIGKHDTITMS